MNDQQHSQARSASFDLATADSGHDWANWLHRAQGVQQSRQPTASTSQIEGAWIALTHVARREGFTVERANCANADGFTTWRNRRIRIRPDAPTAQAVTALAHQLGHVMLHDQIARLEPSGTIPCTGIRKVEADSVAFLVATYVGIDTTTVPFPHVSSWAGIDSRARPTATIEAVTSRILNATATITARLYEAGFSAPRQLAPVPSSRAGSTGHPADSQLTEDEHALIHQSASLFFRGHLPGSWVPGYLAGRGLDRAVQEQWHVGAAPAAWAALVTNLRATGYSDELIEASGLARRSRRGTLIDTFRDRAILPIRSTDGTIIAFIGRATDHAAPGTPKYLNSPATSVYQKGEILFGLWEARDALASRVRPVIVEGPLDAIAVTIAGRGKYVGLAPCGTALTTHQTAALAQAGDLRTTGVTIAFDADQAGRRAAVRAYDLFVPHTDKLAAATIPSGQDPAQILARSGPAALAEVLTSHTRPLPDLVINTEVARWGRSLRYPEGQIHALRATAPLIAAMPPAHVARQVARIAAILKLDHATVTKAVTEAVSVLAASPTTWASRDISAQHSNRRPASVIHAKLRPERSAATQARVEAAAARRQEPWRPPTQSRSGPRSG